MAKRPERRLRVKAAKTKVIKKNSKKAARPAKAVKKVSANARKVGIHKKNVKAKPVSKPNMNMAQCLQNPHFYQQFAQFINKF
jgi:Cu/Ag efflux protein CusF